MEEQAGAKVLKYTQEVWDADKAVDEYWVWDNMRPAQQQAV